QPSGPHHARSFQFAMRRKRRTARSRAPKGRKKIAPGASRGLTTREKSKPRRGDTAVRFESSMELKDFQRRVIDDVERYLTDIAARRARTPDDRHAAVDAWRDLRLPARYNERENGLGHDLPTFCSKVPTGGGKTLIATQVLGAIHRTILKDRNG